MLRGKALEDAPGRVALLMPILAILLEPLVDQGSVVVQHRGRPSFCGDLRREVPILTYLRTVGSEALVFLDISAIDEPSRCICLISCITGILIISFPTSFVED